jgi:hypothetical protein
VADSSAAGDKQITRRDIEKLAGRAMAVTTEVDGDPVAQNLALAVLRLAGILDLMADDLGLGPEGGVQAAFESLLRRNRRAVGLLHSAPIPDCTHGAGGPCEKKDCACQWDRKRRELLEGH